MRSAGIIVSVILLSAIRTSALNHTIQGQITSLFSQMTPDTLPIQGITIQATNYPSETDTITDTTDINGYFSILTGIEENNNIITPIKKINSYLVGEEFNLNLYLKENNINNSDLELKIFDLLGREIENKTKRAEQGKNVFNIDLRDLKNGNYFYKIEKENKQINKGKLTLFKGIDKLDIDLNNSYSLSNSNGAIQSSLILPPFETYKLKLTDQENRYYQRITYLTINSDTFINENLADTSLPMEFFDEVCRWGGNAGTQRRLTQCIWYIDTSAAIGTGISPTQAQIDTVLRIIREDIPVFTDNYISGADEFIEIGNNPPPLGTEPYHIVRWNDDIHSDGAHGEILDGFEIIAAHVYLRTYLQGGGLRVTALQELSQTLGPRNDTQNPEYDNSVFWRFGNPFYVDIDLKAGKFLYNRPLGNRTPDIDLAPF